MADPGAAAGVERHGRPRNPGNDTAILDAALDLLIERGAAGTSIEAVAQRAGVAKLTVYRRWRAKDDLLMAALEHARAPDMDTAPAGQSIDELTSSIAELLSRPRFRTLMARVIGASIDYPKLVTAYTERYLQPRLNALAQIAQQAIDAGHLPPDTDPSVIQDILASSIGSVLLQHAENVTAAQLERRLRILLHHIGYQP
ncbi:TetR/AcrR family transcriptional regulator [Streptosporangium sp. NBC_01756]|uniref:TetR/AcrR family transcriptional regulator n=1 Tax=Streptosporangium sp. NBC_01756 TaxID=2975950 RepID=UPI002DD8A32D|nr:TetR/AcrR family transcriptional regulator [Streptosporangium sp. NBC_01756]WSC86395.1 TetR/AcrR family transcriptional regulator [Streptosporangium sp. NBC_01756]